MLFGYFPINPTSDWRRQLLLCQRIGKFGRRNGQQSRENWLRGGATSFRDISDEVGGYSVLASAEVGIPLVLDEMWTLEPQAQLIWQRIALDSTSDRFTSIDYGNIDGVTGRVGARLEANTTINGQPAQFFASADFWHQFSTQSAVTFNAIGVNTTAGGSSLELQAGLNGQITNTISAFGAVSYNTGLSGDSQRSFGANVGFRVKW